MSKSKSRSKSRSQLFSAIKAIKANSRERLGTPPPSHPLPTVKEKMAARPRHKQTLTDLLESQNSDQ